MVTEGASLRAPTLIYYNMAAAVSDGLAQPSRPIERLQVRRLSNEPREAMNCKSCRKRKVCTDDFNLHNCRDAPNVWR